MELDQNSDNCSLDPNYDAAVSTNTMSAHEDTIFLSEEETGRGLPFGSQWLGDGVSKFDPGIQTIKTGDATRLVPVEKVGTVENEGVRLNAWPGVPTPVSYLKEQVKEYDIVHVERHYGLKNTDNIRKGLRMWSVNVNENRGSSGIPTDDNSEAFCDAESDQASENNESLEPKVVVTDDDQVRNVTSVLDPSYNLIAFDGKCSPDFNLEETSNAVAESQKEMVSLRELSLKVVESTEIVKDIVGSKATASMDKTCREKVCYRGDFENEEKAEDGRAERLTPKETSKKKKKWKKAAKKANSAGKRTPDRTEPENAHAITNSYASYFKPGSDNTYARGIIPVGKHFFENKFPPSNLNANAQGFRPAVEQSFVKAVGSEGDNSSARGFRPSDVQTFGRRFDAPTEHSYARDIKSPSELSYQKDSHQTSKKSRGGGFKMIENSSSRAFQRSNDNSCDRDFKPTCEQSTARGCHRKGYISYGRDMRPKSEHSFANPVCPQSDTSRGRGLRPSSEHYSAKSCYRTNDNSYGRDTRPTSQNSFANGTRSQNENSRGRGFGQSREHFSSHGCHRTYDNSCGRGLSTTSEHEHSSSSGFPRASDSSYGRGLRPTGEQSYPRVFYQTVENSRGTGFRLRAPSEQSSSKVVYPAPRDMSYTKAFGPTCGNSFANSYGGPVSQNSYTSRGTGNVLARGSQPGNMNLPRDQKVSSGSTWVAKREQSALHADTVMPRLSRLETSRPHDRFGSSVAYPGGRQVAVVKPRPKEETEVIPRKALGPQTECDFIEMILATDNMFDARSVERKKGPRYEKRGEGGTNLQNGVSREWPRKGKGQYNSEGSMERGLKSGGGKWSPAEGQQDHKHASDGLEESEEMEPPLQLKYVHWVGKDDIGHFFISGLTTTGSAGDGESGCHSQPNVLTFDQLVLLDELETAVVSVTDSIEMVVGKGFVARFPESCNLHLLVNENDRIYPEFIIACCSCPKPIIAHQVGAVKSCPKCRFVRLGTYPEMKLKCQFILLRSAHVLRFVLLSSSLSVCEWEKSLHFGWYYDFPAVKEARSNYGVSPDKKTNSAFSKDLTEFLSALQISDLSVLSGIDFSSISPAVRLIHTKPGSNCTNDPLKYGSLQLQKIIRSLVWKAPKKKQSLYKTERLGQRCYSILNDVFPNALSGDFQSSIKRVKVAYPSSRWVNECVANSEFPDRLDLLPTVKDIRSFGDLPWNFFHDLIESKDFVQNYNVLMQYESWEESGKTKRYGWLLTGSHALDAESWGDDFPVYHKITYKHFQLSVGLFPYLRKNENSKDVDVCAVDLCDVPLPFDPVAIVHYRPDDMPRLVLGSGVNAFSHCVGVFMKSRKSSFGFIRQSPEFRGWLDPFPAPMPGQLYYDVFLHVSSLTQLELPQEGSIVEFFFLNEPPMRTNDFVKVCNVFPSVKEAKSYFLSTMPDVAFNEQMVHKEMVEAKALSLGLPVIDDVQKMEDAIEDYYNVLFSSRRRCFSYFPTQAQVDAISMEPVKILSDEDWIKDYYKNRQNPGGLPHDVGLCRPKALLASFQAMKYRFVKDLREVEELNKKLEEENRGYIKMCCV